MVPRAPNLAMYSGCIGETLRSTAWLKAIGRPVTGVWSGTSASGRQDQPGRIHNVESNFVEGVTLGVPDIFALALPRRCLVLPDSDEAKQLRWMGGENPWDKRDGLLQTIIGSQPQL